MANQKYATLLTIRLITFEHTGATDETANQEKCDSTIRANRMP